MTREHSYPFTKTNAAVANSALTDIGESGTTSPSIILNGEYPVVWFEVTNTGQNLDDFALLVKPDEDSDWHILISGATWDDEDIAIKPYTSAAINTLATGAKAAAKVIVGPCFAIKFQADAAASTTSVTVHGQARRE